MMEVDVDASEDRLTALYDALRADGEMRSRVSNLLSKLWEMVVTGRTDTSKTEETKFHLGVCLLYADCIDTKFPYGMDDPSCSAIAFPFTVTRLLQASKVNIIDFFNAMRSLRDMHSVSKAVLRHLLTVEKKFLITLPLYQKFKSIAADVFRLAPACSETNAQQEKDLVWALFIYVKETTLPSYRELFESFQLLLSCFEAVLHVTPAFKLKPPFDSIKLESTDTHQETCILRALCDRYNADMAQQLDKVAEMRRECVDPVVKAMIDEDMFEFSGIADRYRELYQQAGDIDELMFLCDDPHLRIVTSNTDAAQCEAAGGPPSPAATNIPTPMTPVRSALNSVQSLENLIATRETQPSSKLLAMFKLCSMDPTNILQARVSTMRQTFLDSYKKILWRKSVALNAGKLASDIARQRVDAAVKLFYKQLESLLLMEEEKLSQKDFSHLLNNTTFSVCLLACCIQFVLATYAHNGSDAVQKPVFECKDDSSFPWILDVFEIQPFDFFKVIDSFIQADDALPSAVVKYLHAVEDQIVEKLAWKKDSPLFISLERCQVQLPALQTPPAGTCHPHGRAEDQIKASSAPHLYLSPMRAHGRVQTPVTPSRHVLVGDSPCKQRAKSHSLSLFLNRVCRLAYQRLQKLCLCLHISRDLRYKIWTCVEYCVSKKSEIMQNRHLDQILMCCIYAICKITEKEIKFKSIVSAYRQLPHATQEVYKVIEISCGEEDSIIVFYNRVFMPKLKAYLMQFQSPTTAATTKVSPLAQSPLSHQHYYQSPRQLSPLTRAPMSPMTRQLQASPVVTLAGRSNFFISPLLNSPFKVPGSPGQQQLTPTRAKQTFSFGESAEKLRAINAIVRSPVTSAVTVPSSRLTPRSHKRLRFDTASDNEDINDAVTESPEKRSASQIHSSPAAKSIKFPAGPNDAKK